MKAKLLSTTALFMFLFSFHGNAQVKIGNNPTTINASSLLELESSTKGVLFPRMTGVQMNAIPSPVTGMFVFNTDSLCLCHYNGTAWRSLCGMNIGAPDLDWHLTGNAGTNPSTNFIGTTDAVDFVTRTDGTERMRVRANGYVGIGTAAPGNKFEIMNDGGTTLQDQRIALRSYTANPNPILFFQTGTGTAAAPTDMTVGQSNGTISFVGQIGGGPALLSRVASKYTGNGTTNKSELNMFTSGVEHWRLDSIGRIMQAINTSVIPNGPLTSFHMYGDGTSGYTPLGTTIQPTPLAGPEIGFSRGGFATGVGAAIQFIDYNAFSGGLAFLVHKGTQNNSGGTFADNWPLDVIQAMTIVSNGQIGVGTGDPTAKLHIMAGAAAASGAPLKFTTGVNSQTIKEAGAVNYDGTDLTLSDATYAYTLSKTLNGSASLDFLAATATTVRDLTITVTGAAVGDPVILGVPAGSVTTTSTFSAWVSAANTVTVRFSPKNNSDNPNSGTFTVRVIK